MNKTEARKAALDGKKVSPKDSACYVYWNEEDYEFKLVAPTLKHESKAEGVWATNEWGFYEEPAKFKVGDFVVYQKLFYRVAAVNQVDEEWEYDIMAGPQIGAGIREYNILESELSPV